MVKSLKSILFVIGAIMVFSAQTYHTDDKGQQHAAAPRPSPTPKPTPSPRPSPATYTRPAPSPRSAPVTYNRPVQTRKEAPRQVVYSQPNEQNRQGTARQQWSQPRVYAVAPSAPAENDRFLNRQHHNNWQPRYNFYDNQYHFYPYVNIASTVDLSSGYMVVGPDGQNYYYGLGTFYLQNQSGQYVAVPPPLGIIVNPIVANARQISVDDQVFWRYKGVFYVQVAQGYQVIGPVQPVPADQ